MIDPRRSARWRLGFVTTGFVSLAAAAAVGWAAATPLGTTATATQSPGSTTQTGQLAAAQANLQQVRRDLAGILAGEDDLPRAQIANLLATQLPTVQVPSASAPVTSVQAAPVIHTTTGASGVVRP